MNNFNAEELATAVAIQARTEPYNGAQETDFIIQGGLTKREYFAGMFLQAFIRNIGDDEAWSMTEVSRTSIQLAEVLLEELGK